MATVSRTFTFTSDLEGLQHLGPSADITASYNASDGDPSVGCLSAQLTGDLASSSGNIYNPSTGETWEDWGVPAGALVTDIQVTAYNHQFVENNLVTAFTCQMEVIDSYGNSVTSDDNQYILNDNIGINGFSWAAGGSGIQRSINSNRQDSDTDVRLKIILTMSALSGNIAGYDLDTIQITLTYTTGSVSQSPSKSPSPSVSASPSASPSTPVDYLYVSCACSGLQCDVETAGGFDCLLDAADWEFDVQDLGTGYKRIVVWTESAVEITFSGGFASCSATITDVTNIIVSDYDGNELACTVQTSEISASLSPSKSPSPSPSGSPSPSPSGSPSPSPSTGLTETLSVDYWILSFPSPSESPSPSPSKSPSPSVSVSPSESPSPSPSLSPSESPSPSVSESPSSYPSLPSFPPPRRCGR